MIQDDNMFESIKEATDADITAATCSHGNHGDGGHGDGSHGNGNHGGSCRHSNRKDDPYFIDWSKKDNLPKWQLQLIKQGLKQRDKPETRL